VDGKFEVAPVVHYDRDVIRPHMLGNFRQMLGAVARSYAAGTGTPRTLGAVHSQASLRRSISRRGAHAGFGDGVAGRPQGRLLGAGRAPVTLCLTGWTISNPYTDG
jgi:hypothetical protein